MNKSNYHAVEAHTSKQNIRFNIINKNRKKNMRERNKKMNDENDRSIKFVWNVERS